MRMLTKLAAASAVTLGGGAAGVLYYQRANKSSSEATRNKPKELTAKEFNALQDATFLKAALNAQHLPWTYHTMKKRHADLRELLTQPTNASTTAAAASAEGAPAAEKESALSYTPSPSDVKLVFYRLLGCPYCAKVEAVLQYHDVPYEEVWIDPITGDGLPDRRYPLAPQLHFTPLAKPTPAATPAAAEGTVTGAFIVDSTAIANALAEPLHYSSDLVNPHTTETRDWITNHFHGASFAITNSTFRNAYDTYPYVTPSRYQNFFYHLVGSGALSALSRFKIQPKLVAKMETPESDAATPPAAGEAARESTGLWMLSPEARATLAATVRTGTAEEWLRAELNVFLARRPANALFHGGKKPDLADVEMYGVSRVVDQHPRLGRVVREGDFGAWQTAMQEKFKEVTGTLYA